MVRTVLTPLQRATTGGYVCVCVCVCVVKIEMRDPTVTWLFVSNAFVVNKIYLVFHTMEIVVCMHIMRLMR